MDLEQHADNMGGHKGGGRLAVWTTAMSSFMLQFLANLVASGTRTSHGFKQVHLKSCARALNERFRVQVTAAQISNHLRKWKRMWAKVNKLKSLSGALWDEHTCTIVLDHEHYTVHIKDHHSDADFLNTPIEHYHEMATICGNGMASGVYARSSNEPLAADVTENEIKNKKTNGGSDPLDTGVGEATMSFTDTNGGNVGDSSGSLLPPKKAKMSYFNLSQQCDAPARQSDTAGSHGMDLEQHADNMGGNNGGGGLAVWTNTMSSFVLQFLANLVACETRTSNGFKQVHLKSCSRALNEHFRVQVSAAQISNHLRKWRRIWAKVNKLKSLSGALWDENTCTIVLDHEHYTSYVKDHLSDADFLNTPVEHYREMATIFVSGKSGSEPLATDVTGNGIENEKTNGGSDPLAKGVEEAAMSFTNTNGGNIDGSSGSLPPPKKAKVNNDDDMLCVMTRSLDNLAKAIEKSIATDNNVPEDLWDNMMDLPGFVEAHLTHYYAHLCENVAVARAFNKLSLSNKMIWVTRYIKNHLSG